MNQEINLPPDFFKQFRTKEEFQGFFNKLFQQGIEALLKAELDEHLGYEKHSPEGYNSGNSRNGSYPKTLQTESLGDLVLNIPRDRNGEFEPTLVPKGQRMSEKLEAAILGMYSRGMSTSDISNQIKEIYGVEVSSTTVSNITGRMLEHIKEWQNRQLDALYYIVWMDGITFKVRHNGKVINKCIFLVLGLRTDGTKEVLGMWVSTQETASFWMSVLTDLKARGVEDILIACTDNLAGFTQAITGVFPQTITQLCVVHQIRNSCKFVVYKERKQFCEDMKTIYTATNREVAEDALKAFDKKWAGKYRHAVQSWYRNWDHLTAFLDYPLELRKMMYTTNAIESLNCSIRKYTKSKVQFLNDEAVQKAVFLAIQQAEKAWGTRPVPFWGLIAQQFLTIFDHRCRI
ncbi:MAG: IS256 family transposase [Daejeonella sp.]